MIDSNSLSSINLADTKIKSESVIGEYAFFQCNNLINIALPQNTTTIGSNAFARSNLSEAVIPENVITVGGDAYAYCQYLTNVTVGSKVKKIEKGAFYESPIKDVYVKALTPPEVSIYLFSRKPVIHVYPQSLEAYQNSEWAKYGTIVGDLK